MLIHLPDANDTLALGALLGPALAQCPAPSLVANGGGLLPLALFGPLGSGKTTLVRGLVSALPGAQQAEVSSPSFNLVNLYPTRPCVAHFDLYRTMGGAPEEFFDQLEAKNVLVAVEWLENIPRDQWPEEALALSWRPVPSGREIEISAWGLTAAGLLTRLTPSLKKWEKEPLR